MRLSKRGDTACGHDDLATWKLRQVAASFRSKKLPSAKIPAKFLEQILLTLKNAGLLHSKMGIAGGYYLAKAAGEISLGQIIRVLDGPVAPIRCVSQMAYESCGCPDEEACGLRLVMFDVRNAMADILDNTSLSDVTNRIEAVRSERRLP
jgi:Rrf2 family protein